MEDLRTLLSRLHTPHRLDCPQVRQLLKAHRRLPHTLSPTAVGGAAAQLLVDKIAAIDPGSHTPSEARLPHRVLHTCFVRGRKLYQAAPELGLSERQLTRERARALQLLAAELATPVTLEPAPEWVPSIEGHIRRADLLRRLGQAAATHRLVSVTGEPGAGKTCLVAALAGPLGPESVFWHRIRQGVNDSLEALVYELGGVLAREGSSELRDYLEGSGVDVGGATRLALDGLVGRRRLLVLDDFASARDPEPLAGFLAEAVARLPELSVVTTGRAISDAAVLQVPSFTSAEIAALARAHGVPCSLGLARDLRILTGGNARMLDATLRWWCGAAGGLGDLKSRLGGCRALDVLTDLIAFTRSRAA